jgi:hypothetical protein
MLPRNEINGASARMFDSIGPTDCTHGMLGTLRHQQYCTYRAFLCHVDSAWGAAELAKASGVFIGRHCVGSIAFSWVKLTVSISRDAICVNSDRDLFLSSHVFLTSSVREGVRQGSRSISNKLASYIP